MTRINRQVPRLVVRDEQPYLSILIKVSLREWGKATALVGELIEWMEENNIPWAGPPFFRYWAIGNQDQPFDIEVGIPVETALPGNGRIIAGVIPAGTYATLIHTGNPDGLDQSLDILQIWGATQGLSWNNRKTGFTEIWGARFEFYLTDPAIQPDMEQWSVELAYQIREERD